MEITKKINAKIEFESGEVINLELYPEVAPITVDNFVKLCNAKFYDGLCFHRVIDKGEFKSNGVNNPLSHEKGVISMARTQVKDSASSQFFICVADAKFLDGEYAAFGKCADDASVKAAVKLGKVKTGSWQYYADIPLNPIVIKTITIGSAD